MSPSEQLNEVLCTHHKAAFACLSATGRRMFFPKGIPAQAAEAKTARINATIGGKVRIFETMRAAACAFVS